MVRTFVGHFCAFWDLPGFSDFLGGFCPEPFGLPGVSGLWSLRDLICSLNLGFGAFGRRCRLHPQFGFHELHLHPNARPPGAAFGTYFEASQTPGLLWGLILGSILRQFEA